MEQFILWCAFIGAWLLFAGPIYQASLELRDEHEGVNLPKKDSYKSKVSGWWWLLPPIKIYLETKGFSKYRKDYINELSSEEIKSTMSFLNKSRAWSFVGLGGLLIAIKETYALFIGLELELSWFWVVIILLIISVLFFVASRIVESERMTSSKFKS